MDKFRIDIRQESQQILRIFNQKDTITVEEMLAKIEDLDDEVSDLESKMREMEEYYNEYYEHKKIDPYDEYGISENDFH